MAADLPDDARKDAVAAGAARDFFDQEVGQFLDARAFHLSRMEALVVPAGARDNRHPRRSGDARQRREVPPHATAGQLDDQRQPELVP